MTHKELIDQLSDELDLTKSEVHELVKKITSEFTDQLGNGTGFTIPDLGTFKTKMKDVQKIYNPHYKKYMLVPPKQTVDFSPGKVLKGKIKFIKPE